MSVNFSFLHADEVPKSVSRSKIFMLTQLPYPQGNSRMHKVLSCELNAAVTLKQRTVSAMLLFVYIFEFVRHFGCQLKHTRVRLSWFVSKAEVGKQRGIWNLLFVPMSDSYRID